MADSITLIPSTTVRQSDTAPLPLVAVSPPAKGAGYYGSAYPMHTVQYSMASGFNGNIKIQATLVTTPADGDWFDIESAAYSDDLHGKPGDVIIKSFPGNFLWIRSIATLTGGTLNHVQYSHS